MWAIEVGRHEPIVHFRNYLRAPFAVRVLPIGLVSRCRALVPSRDTKWVPNSILGSRISEQHDGPPEFVRPQCISAKYLGLAGDRLDRDIRENVLSPPPNKFRR